MVSGIDYHFGDSQPLGSNPNAQLFKPDCQFFLSSQITLPLFGDMGNIGQIRLSKTIGNAVHFGLHSHT
jgi:hypothetical protein